jgi:spermidine synthase
MGRDGHSWQQRNLEAIHRRLDRLRREPDGVLHEQDSGLHRIRVIKDGGQVQLYFVEPDGALAGPMSRIVLDRPLHLLAGYTQALALALIFRPQPRRVCVLGFGGGRLSLVLHHHLPDAVIESVDIDPAFGPIAERFFGLAYDARQRLFVADGRAHLEGAGAAYEVLVMDAFSDSSDNLDHLATREFYALCRRRLAPGGVVCANLLRSDPRFDAKLAAFRASFRQVYAVALRRSLVLFGNDRARPSDHQVARRASELQRIHGFDFPFLERAQELRPYRGGPGGDALEDRG